MIGKATFTSQTSRLMTFRHFAIFSRATRHSKEDSAREEMVGTGIGPSQDAEIGLLERELAIEHPYDGRRTIGVRAHLEASEA
jgi:hypothetical protein